MNEFKNINNYFSFVPLYNFFIEKYMIKANPSFVIVYIYILKMFINNDDIYLDNVSNKLNMLASDVIKALDYWQYEKIISYKQVENKVEITFFSKKQENINEISNNINTKEDKVTIYSQKEEIQKLFRLAEKKLAKTLSYQDRHTLISLYEDYGMSMEILAVLLTYCVENGKNNFRYIGKVGIDWCENNIDSLEKVEAYLKTTNEDYRTIMKAFGISNRAPIKKEEDFIKKWILEYKMTIPVVQEACTRTILQTGQVSFDYANKIIENWKENNIKTLDDIKKLDDQFENSRKAKEEIKKSVSMQKTYKNNINYYNKNKFVNYSQKEPDYELLRKLEIMALKEGIDDND